MLHNWPKVTQLVKPTENHRIGQDLGDRCIRFLKLELGTGHEIIYLTNLTKIKKTKMHVSTYVVICLAWQ